MEMHPRKTPRSFLLWLKTHKRIGGGCLLFSFLFLASVIVPLTHPYSLDVANPEAANLPAKIVGVGQGVYDGTGEVKKVLLDPKTGYPAPENGKVIYPSFAILGDLKTDETTSDELSEAVKAYGRGGAVRLSLLSVGREGALHARPFTYDSQDDYSLVIDFDALASSRVGHSPSFAVFLRADFLGDNTYASAIPLSLYSQSYESLNVTSEAIKAAVCSSSAYLQAGKTTFSAYPELRIQAVEEGPLPSLFVRSFRLTSRLDPEAVDAAINFTDATQMLAAKTPWEVAGEAEKGVYQSHLSYADFRFDFYARAFGYPDSGFEERLLSEEDIDGFRSRGFLRYDWQRKASTDGSSFAILDDEHCPLRSFREERYDGATSQLVGLVSPYRYQYFKGYLPTCAPQAYLLGTTAEGKDFAKLLFAGLASSYAFAFGLTALGLLGAYFLGLVWSYHEDSKPQRRRFFFLFSAGFWSLSFILIVLSSRSAFGLLLLGSGALAWLLGAGILQLNLKKKGEGSKLPRRSGAILPPRFDQLALPGLFLFPAALVMEGVGAALFPGLLASLDYPSLASAFTEARILISFNPLPFWITLALLLDSLASLALLLDGVFRLRFSPSGKSSLRFGNKALISIK